MLVVVGVHLAGVALASWLHHENLVRAMVTGSKSGHPDQGIHGAWPTLGVMLLVAVLGFWLFQWRGGA